MLSLNKSMTYALYIGGSTIYSSIEKHSRTGRKKERDVYVFLFLVLALSELAIKSAFSRVDTTAVIGQRGVQEERAARALAEGMPANVETVRGTRTESPGAFPRERKQKNIYSIYTCIWTGAKRDLLQKTCCRYAAAGGMGRETKQRADAGASRADLKMQLSERDDACRPRYRSGNKIQHKTVFRGRICCIVHPVLPIFFEIVLSMHSAKVYDLRQMRWDMWRQFFFVSTRLVPRKNLND